METDILVIGAGQSGLALSAALTARGAEHAVLEANDSPGDVWRSRWRSLRLFTPARFDSLPGACFPAEARYCPAADEFADYLDAYAERFCSRVRCGVHVTAVRRDERGFEVRAIDSTAETTTWRAQRVVVATGGHSRPNLPPAHADLDSSIPQWHTSQYREPDDLPPGRVLVVGCGSSGVQLGTELARNGRRVIVAGDPSPAIPRALLAVAGGIWFSFLHRALTRATPIGRRAAARAIGSGAPLIGVSARDLDRVGAERAPRLVGTVDGLPELADGRVVEADAVLWATGYSPGLDWIDGLELDEYGLPEHERGISSGIPGMAFLGLPFQYGLTSTLIGGAARDAGYVAERLVA